MAFKPLQQDTWLISTSLLDELKYPFIDTVIYFQHVSISLLLANLLNWINYFLLTVFQPFICHFFNFSAHLPGIHTLSTHYAHIFKNLFFSN